MSISYKPDSHVTGAQRTVAVDALNEPNRRREFLRRATFLSLAIPGVGGALSACDDGDAEEKAAAHGADSGDQPQNLLQNPDSMQDEHLQDGASHPPTSMTGPIGHLDETVPFHRYDPALPPPPSSGVLDVHYYARESRIRIASNTVVAGWTFEGDIPAPILHCRVGDTVNFTLTNETYMPHSMDFHAAQINPETAFRSILNGQSLSYTFKPRYAGAFLYHCGTAPVLMHIGAGMYGAIIVSPKDPLPPAREFVLVQSEYYLGDAINGVRPFDYSQMLSVTPDFVVFNGRVDQYTREPIRVKVGDRVRFWVVTAGPTLSCAFHLVGEQWDTVYIAEPPGNALRGLQTFDVPPGGGMVFELACDIAGTFAFVNHAFGHGQKGAIGYLVVEP